MSNKKQLNENELEKISGGCYGLEDPKYPSFSGYLNMYSLTENEEYYFVYMKDDKNFWLKGILLKSWEQESCFDKSRRTHQVRITDPGNLYLNRSVGDVIELYGDYTAAYKHRG